MSYLFNFGNIFSPIPFHNFFLIVTAIVGQFTPLTRDRHVGTKGKNFLPFSDEIINDQWLMTGEIYIDVAMATKLLFNIPVSDERLMTKWNTVYPEYCWFGVNPDNAVPCLVFATFGTTFVKRFFVKHLRNHRKRNGFQNVPSTGQHQMRNKGRQPRL